MTDKAALNEQEALGVTRVERYLLEDFDYPADLSVGLALVKRLVQKLNGQRLGGRADAR